MARTRAESTLDSTRVTLGLRQNLAQFTLLVAINALVGGTLGQERTVLPLLASQTFHLDLYTSALNYILAFGLSKAAMNYFAGTLSDRYGRKPVLVTGGLVAIPVPLMLIFGPSWEWIVAANVFLASNPNCWTAPRSPSKNARRSLRPQAAAVAGRSPPPGRGHHHGRRHLTGRGGNDRLTGRSRARRRAAQSWRHADPHHQRHPAISGVLPQRPPLQTHPGQEGHGWERGF